VRITSLGHAGFLVETEGAVIVTDPWMSEHGAFDAGWMQLPRNHHLAELPRRSLEEPGKARFLYVSHEHEDHFDRAFLESIGRRDFTIVAPRFARSAMRDFIDRYGCREAVYCEDGQEVAFPGGRLKLYVSDSALNRDSALLVRGDGRTFLDLNDCKIHDRLAAIAAAEGTVDVFTAQFSGAVWHPTCYEYDSLTYAAISRKKMFSKFEAVARAILALRPRAFVSSAGPACFLDPDLLHLNFQPVSIFPRAPRLFAYLARRLRDFRPVLIEPMPGDVIDAERCEAISLAAERLTDATFETHVRAYADRMSPLYAERRQRAASARGEEVLGRLAAELSRKLDAFALRARVTFPLYVVLEELPERALHVDFAAGRVEVVCAVPAADRYVLRARAFDVARILDRAITWEEFFLSFRLRLSRIPDRYDPLMHGFLALEAEDLPHLCRTVLANEARQERIVVEAGGRRYSVVRYCPHQGADLSEAWIEKDGYLVCPRHRWQFDLKDGGRCVGSTGCSIAARCIEADTSEERPRGAQPLVA
jgi:UDP-MurNAc hydroxylase